MRMTFRSLILSALIPATALIAAVAPTASAQLPTASVAGVVRDSVMHIPLIGAMVQLVAADNPTRYGTTALSDSLGRFNFTAVPDGRYNLGFFHPLLDSIGVEAPLREIAVAGGRPVRTVLGTPSAERLRTAICSKSANDSSSGLVIGVVRGARDRAPQANVIVTGEWVELTLAGRAFTRRVPRLTAKTGENGWFAMCGVPASGTVALMASRGADSTDRVEVQIGNERFLRQELSLGNARTIVVGDSVKRTIRMGDVRLTGTIVAAVDGRPLSGAQVGIVDGPRTRTNERGEWTIVDAPSGTRMLEARAVSYYPDLRAVDVVAGAPPIRIALATLKSVLDTVRVTSSRSAGIDRGGFEERRMAGLGRFILPAEIARKNPFVISDLFKNLPGTKLERTESGVDLLIRGNLEAWCKPNIFLNGQPMPRADAEDLDGMAAPKEVTGIEIYASSVVPPQYQQAFGTCGSILIWAR